MRRISYKPFIFLLFFFFLMISLPLKVSERIRYQLVQSLHMGWEQLTVCKEHNRELEHLKLENHSLRAQVRTIREWLLFEERIENQLEKFHEIAKNEEEEQNWRDFFERRGFYLSQILEKQFQSLPAQVIFREPTAWNSSIWLNVGEKDNEVLGRTIIAKNSPVLVGTTVVGIIEWVGPHQSRVRLITDEGLTPAVRAVRGGENNRFLLEHIDALILGLEVRDDLRSEILDQLHQFRGELSTHIKDGYLAKGELRGCGKPLWRSRGQLLRGIGFNYDYSDEEGVARDLRSSDSILKVGDLLVTSGLDGVFPQDLPVAIVTKIYPLKEGACSYELEARSLIPNLNDIHNVHVLPPM